MGLADAIDKMREGRPVTRLAWQPGKGNSERWFIAYVILLVPARLVTELKSYAFYDAATLWWKKEGMLIQVTYGGDRMPWSPEAKDLLADDWHIYNGPPAPVLPPEEEPEESSSKG